MGDGGFDVQVCELVLVLIEQLVIVIKRVFDFHV